MKKNFKACKTPLLLLLLLAVIFVMPGQKTEAATANEKLAFEFFTDTMGLSPAAACGVMSNIKSESGFIPDITGPGGSYGICQWMGVRRTRLYSWCSSKGHQPSSLKGQLHYLQYELKTYYPGVYNYLKSVKNTSEGAYHAAFYFCYYFEAPLNTYNTSVARGRQAQNTYWKTLGSSAVYATAKAVSGGIRLSWSGSSKKGYRILRASSKSGTYSVVASIPAGASKTYTDRSAAVGKKYYYYLEQVSSEGKTLEKSNRVSCRVIPTMKDDACRITLSKTEYVYNGKNRRPAVKVTYDGTVLKEGVHYTLTYSNHKNAGTAAVKVTGKGQYGGVQTVKFTIKKAEQKLKVSSFSTVMKSGLVSVSASAKGKISLKSENSSVAAVKKGKLDLKKPGVARITVRAAATANYKAASKTITLTVTPAKPVLSGVRSTASGKASVSWKKSRGLDGYEVQYTTGSKFTSKAEAVIVSGEAGACTLEDLPAGKNCRFRVRSFVVLNNKKIYSKWSKIRSIKIKK